MPKDWEKSRTELIAELRHLRRERERFVRQGDGPMAPASAMAMTRLQALYHVTSCLSGSGALPALAVGVLRELAQCESWDVGMLWLTDQATGVLHLAASWLTPTIELQTLESLSRQMTFLPGQGPLGHQWGQGEQSALFDVVREGRSPRALYAAKAGLLWAAYFPLWHQGALLGFLEFFGSEPVRPEGERSQLMASAGHQVIQRVLRDRSEAECRLRYRDVR